MRVTLLYLVVAALAIYSWRDWFKSLCGLIVLVAFMENRDMPRQIEGIEGLNLLNLLMANTTLAWAVSRRREGLKWDMPQIPAVLLVLYFVVMVVGSVRTLWGSSQGGTPTVGMWILDATRWIVPGLLLFDGCRSRQRLRMAMLCIAGFCFLLAVQVANDLPAECALGTGGGALQRIRLHAVARLGYSTCNMSALLAGASWSMLACVLLFRPRWPKLLLVGAAVVTLYAQALTGGRMGYVTWGVIGLTLCLLRWRKSLLAAPLVLGVLYLSFPGVVERLATGFGERDSAGQTAVNEDEVFSGRTQFWPHVIDKIAESPMVGHGREAMLRLGFGTVAEGNPHPHNAYMEWLLDNGILGFMPVLLFYALVVAYAASLFRDRSNPYHAAVGGVALSLTLAQLVAGVGSQHLYPRVSTLGMWAAIFLMLRVYVEQQKALSAPLASDIQRGMPRY